jgi:hypothetical protein
MKNKEKNTEDVGYERRESKKDKERNKVGWNEGG